MTDTSEDNQGMLWESGGAKRYYTARKNRKPCLEEWVILYLLAAEREVQTPVYFYGIVNSLHLYLDHPHYSPFKPLSAYCTQEQREKLIEGMVSFHDPKKLMNVQGKFFTQEEWDDHCQEVWKNDEVEDE